MADLRDVTVAITSFLRPGMLFDCIERLRKFLPECSILVADDSEVNPELDSSITMIRLPFDVGLPRKRNVLAICCVTKYMLMFSDDFSMDEIARQGVDKLLAVMEEHPEIDLAGGRHNGVPYEGFLTEVKGESIKETRLVDGGLQPYYIVDIMANYWMCRPKLLREIPQYEPCLIGGEHGLWFAELMDAKKICVYVPGVNVNALPYNPAKVDPRYASYRARARSLGHEIFLKKRNIKEYIGFPPI